MKKRHHYQTVTLLFIATLLSISTYNCAEIEVDIEDETSNRVLLREPETHEPIININNVVVHNDTIYIGAENVLLKVDARTLRIVQSVRTGPLLDSPMCRYAPREECLYSRRKSLTPNYNKIVLVLPDTQSLLTCWTAFQGVCETRDLDDLSRLKSNSTVAVVANDPVNSTIAFQATSPNSQRLLYVATTYTSLGAYRDDLPALSGRSLQPHRFMQVIESNNQLKTVKSSIEFVSRFRKSFIVKYITGFNLGLHNYYLSVQHTDTDALIANQPLATKISRLCLNDLSFTKSYTEITLKCLSGSRGSISSLRSVDYNELIASKLVDIDGEHFLIGLFQQTSRTNFNMSLHTSASSTNNNNAPIRQAICVYPMKAVTAKIHENINRCYNSDSESQVMRGLNFIKPDQKCSYSSRRPTSADDYCASSADNGLYPIGGQQPLQTNSIIEFDTHSQLDKYSSSFDTMQFINRRSQESDSTSNNILILMSTARSQLSLYAFTSLFSEPQLIRTVRLRPDDETVSTSTVIRTPLTNIQPTENGQSVIVATGSSLYKVELDSCASLKTCAQCAAKSPHCGWCSGQCTTSSQCPSSQWLSGPNVDEVCADVRAISPQRKFKYDNEWIEVEFKRDLALLVPSNASYECVFRTVGNGEDETRNDAILVSATKLKCALPHSSKIRFNAFTEQQLELSADGLFRVSPANKYYYEQSEDETSLQVHIRTKAGQELGLRPRHNVTLVDCNAHRSCISCMSTSGCEWCSNRCSNPSEIESKSECRSDAAQCESFDTGTSKLLIPFTAHRQQAPLLVSLSNLGSGEAPLECMFTLFNGRSIARNLTVPYQPVNATHANCALNGVFNILAGLIDYDGQVQTNLRLYDPRKDVFVDSISNGRLALLFYKCEIKAADCSQCLSVNPQLSCMWCQSSATKPSCRFMNAQSKQAQLAQCISSQVLSSKSGSNASSLYQCDKPQVDLIEPSKLPIGGGTVLSIYGNNLGSRFEDIMEVNLVCPENNGIAIKCDLIERKYVSSRQIWCETRASLSGVQYGCKVMVKLRPPPSATGLSSGEYVFVTSSQLVDYVDPIISDIEPKQVIESAKYVWLTITGVDLDAGRSRSIQIIDYAPSSDNNEQQSSGTQTTNTRMVKCEIKNSTSKQIRCRLNDKFEQLGKKNLKLAYDKSMTVLNYLSLRVHSDPIVKSIDCKQTIYAGGTSFKLHGLGFDSVQSIYAYVSYRNVWYSEPVQARARLSNDLIEFDYPPLNDAFHSLVLRQQQQQQQQTNDPLSVNYELEIGFLMDGFNVTLKNTLVTYRPNPKISVSSLHIEMQQPDIIDESTQTATNSFVLAADVNIDPSLYHLYHSGVIRDNFQVFIGCSLCTNPSWFNQSRFSCRLPALNQKFATTNQSSAQCESKIYSIILSKLNQNQLSLLNIVVGNMEVTNEAQIDDNLKIYMQTFTLNNVDNFMQVAQRLSAQTTNSHLINKLIKSGGSLMGVDDDSTSNSFLVAGFHGSSSSSRNLLIVSSIIGAMLIILAIFTLVLVSIVVRIKRRNRKLDSIGISGEQKFRLSSRKMALSNTMSSSLTSNSVGKKRSEKHMKLEFEQIQKQVDMLEMQIRGRCAQAYQQLHQDYVNELNNELIYNVYSMPMWNYGSYLLNLFSARVDLGLDEQAAALPSPAQIPHNPSMMMANGHLMSSSSMSNSTTNTLLSQTHHMKQLTPGGPPSHPAPPPPSIPPPAAPGQQQQPLNSTMSVYATIKSSSMLRFDALDTPTACDPHLQNRHQQLLAAYGQLGEAMHLFDQLLHNKNFLLTFVSSYAASHRHSHADLNALAGLICLSLRDNLPYLYSIIKALISEHIRKSISSVSNGTSSTSKTSKSSTKHLSKSLFRSENTAEFTLVECLVSNFLGMFMFDFQRDTQCSTHLYRLVRVVGHYLDSAPCDSVQQRAMNSLSEDKLLVIDGAEYQMIYVNVAFASQSQSANKALFVVPLVDLDTVEQAKEKCIDVVARHGGFSGVLGVRNRPTSRDVDLELCLIIIPSEQQQQQQQQPNASTMIVLRDTEEELLMHQNHGFGSNLNSNNINKNGSKRLLTLKDYNIQSGSFINLSLRTSQQQQQQQQQQQDTNQHVYMSTMSMANEYQVYASSSSSSGQPLLTTTTSTTMTITPSNNQRFHLLKPTESTATAVINSHNPFSTTASTASSSSDTQSSSITSTTTSNNNSTNKKSSSKSSKYEKLLTVKSQDSGVTTASLLIPPPPTSPPPSKTTILTRLLLNKGTVQPFIDQFVESIFLNTANLPPIVQHLFEFVDAEIRKFGGESVNRNVADELARLSRAWKTHVLFVRYWTQLIRSPEILFDCRKSPLLQASLDCIAQALMDSCSSMDAHNLYDTNSPTNRLLFIREVPRYKLMIDQFYSDLKQSQPISDHELHFYLNEFGKVHPSTPLTAASQHQQPPVEINQAHVLLKCYSLYEKCEAQCNQALGQQQCSILLPVHHRLVQIKDLIAVASGASPPPPINPSMTMKPPQPALNPTATLNPNYLAQFVSNTYAATSDVCLSHFGTTLPHHNQIHHNFQLNPNHHQPQQYF